LGDASAWLEIKGSTARIPAIIQLPLDEQFLLGVAILILMDKIYKELENGSSSTRQFRAIKKTSLLDMAQFLLF
tara:strand:+ start:918 stop:1139 length:222 start_codon:yes stop_codon:yes gene_type:complete